MTNEANSRADHEAMPQTALVVGYVPGGFDLFHIGHLNILRAARERCDYLIVGVATDESLVAQKGRQPAVPYEERAEIVAAIDLVERVVPDHGADKRIAWQDNKFDVLFKGSDWQGTPKGDRLEAEMAEVGARVVYFPYTERTSSTMLRDYMVATSAASQPAAAPTWQPSVTAVIATRNRPELLRRAVSSALQQDYAGSIEVVAVFDQSEVEDLSDLVPAGAAGPRAVRSVANSRTPGLAGARNTGIMTADTELVAFCDDDDEWKLTKLTAQIAAWEQDPRAVIIATGIKIVTTSSTVVRTPAPVTDHEDFVLSRLTEIHPSSFLMRRKDLLGPIGLVDEELPASYGEDYDLLLRATRHGHVRAVLEPLLIVNWNRTSFFAERWLGIADGLTYLIQSHPDLQQSKKGLARVAAQVAFAHACVGNRKEALSWARVAITRDPTQLRAYAALVGVTGVPVQRLLPAVNALGRGM